MRSPLILCLLGGLAACAPASTDAPVAAWAKWGMSDAKVVAGSAGRLSPARLEEPGHLQEQPLQLISTGRLSKDGREFEATFRFDRHSRELYEITLHLEGQKACADLLGETLTRQGQPDRVLQGSSGGKAGMYIWSKQRPLMLNYRPAFSDCALIYAAPRNAKAS